MIIISIVYIALLSLINLWAIRIMMRGSAFVRLVEVDSLQDVEVEQMPFLREYQESISGESWATSQDELLKSMGALRWCMNRVRNYRPDPVGAEDPVALLKAVEAGKATLCGGMAAIFQHVLAAVGMQSRTVLLQSSIFNPYDAHTTVEVKLNGKWVIMDPTFHVTFTGPEGNWLSAQEIRNKMFSAVQHDIKINFHGDVTYPIRLENYYLSVLHCFNNVFIIANSKSMMLLKLPPLRYWFGPKQFFQKLPLESASHLVVMQQCYYVTSVILPMLIVFFVLFTFAVL